MMNTLVSKSADRSSNRISVFAVIVVAVVLALLRVLSPVAFGADLPTQRTIALPARKLASAPALAQVPHFNATNLHKSTELSVQWLLHPGDDLSYARPDLNDSQWIRFDARESVKKLLPEGRPEVLWYRLHVNVSPGQTRLALIEHQISSAFELYVNGQRILQSGQVAPFVPFTLGARQLVRIPDALTASGSLVIALRVHISRTEWAGSDPGYSAENLTLGDEDALQEHILLSVIESGAIAWAIYILGFAVGIVALALFSAQRRQFEYLWIFLQFFCEICTLPFSIYGATHNFPVSFQSLQLLLHVAAFFFEILMFLTFLRIRPGWWTRGLCLLAAVGLALSAIGVAEGSLSIYGAILAQVPLLFLIAGVLPLMLIIHLRRGNREAGILLIPILLSSISIYVSLILLALSTIPAYFADAVRWNTMLISIPVGPFVVSGQQVGILLYVVSIGIIMVLRSTRMSRQQAMLEGEVAAAREIQQVILPEKIEAIAGFTIESVYEPAQQVGGDFFQILPTGDGGLLLVLGDVAGKGLPAAILVSVMVGAIRATADYTHQPQDLLVSLNERLVGRSHGGFSTALAAHITHDGRVTISNAGHLSPYLDGQELELPVALPLGILGGVAYDTMQFDLLPGRRLTFYSDGVIEAQNQSGELLGFARGQELSTQSAASIAEVARLFGQSDDITVVAIQRHALLSATA